MTQPIRSRDVQPRTPVRPILPPRIDARTHLDVARAYLELGLPNEALFELSLVDGDPTARSEAEGLRARIQVQIAPANKSLSPARPAPSGSATRIEGLRPKSRVVPVAAAAVEDAIDLAFDECFREEAPTCPEGPPVVSPAPASGTRLKRS